MTTKMNSDESGLHSAPISGTIGDADLERWFTYHPPREVQTARYELLRAQALVLARLIHTLTPPGADQSAALRKLREAIMTANAAIEGDNPAQAGAYIRTPEPIGGPK